MSDWSAQHSTISAVMGLDVCGLSTFGWCFNDIYQMSMPGDIYFDSNTSYFGGNLTAYVMNGTIPLSRVDDMATRQVIFSELKMLLLMFPVVFLLRGITLARIHQLSRLSISMHSILLIKLPTNISTFRPITTCLSVKSAQPALYC
jgi:hypothetical protein